MASPKGGRPFTDLDREQLRQLHAQGAGRNEIARIMGRPAGTITGHAAKFDPPLSFDRTATKDATAARQADQAAQRVRILSNIQDLIEVDHIRMRAVQLGHMKWTTIMRNSDGSEKAVDVDFIPSVDWQRHANSAASLTAAMTKLTALDDTTGSEEDREMLLQISAALKLVRPAQ